MEKTRFEEARREDHSRALNEFIRDVAILIGIIAVAFAIAWLFAARPAAASGNGEWATVPANQCVPAAGVAWWVTEAFSKAGMSGPIRFTLRFAETPKQTEYRRDGAGFVFYARWREGGCLHSWRVVHGRQP